MTNSTTVVHAGRIIVGDGRMIENGTMTVVDGRIVGIRADDAGTPAGARSIDASGLTLMPGLVDCHTHLGGASSPDYRTWVIEDDLRQAVISTKQMRELMDWGVTTIRDISRNGIRLKWAVDHGHLDGPRIVACGPGISRTGGHGDAHNLPLETVQHSHPWGYIADGPEDLRKAVRTLSRMGSDAIKIWATGGGMWDKELETDQHFDFEEITAIIREADHLRIPVLAHAESLAAAKDCIRAGVATVEHGEELDDECRTMMVERGIVHVPTLQLFLGPWFDEYPPPPRGGLDAYPGATPVEREKFRVTQNFLSSIAAGVQIAVGSDSFSSIDVPFGYSTVEEIKTMVGAGMPRHDVFTSATSIGARALRVDDVTGTLEEGKAADFLIVDGDPWEDIESLHRDNLVWIQRGEQVWKDLLTPRSEYVPRAALAASIGAGR
ncbi:amidohydrolase family protein [Leucobacter allii]|uniref:Amidohydrolase family protein n=1 Tax=Leucobacter allii TaxID=2932247 RepID=A0ABY4FJV0_9MICO|nr:amidohydrolase family protein [Leucobacter allii]UOQ56418.1 amidohydrolase family protein [Leucobacter allii]